MNAKFDLKSEKILKVFLIVFSFLLQWLYIPTLPAKYFYDSSGILSIANNTYGATYFDNSYLFSGNFFRYINIFNFSTFMEWAYFLTFIFSIITVIYLLKFKNLTIIDFLFIYCTIGLANIYIYRISKDFIQLLIWFLIYIVTIFIKSDKIKNLLIFLILIIESQIFRGYYIAIGFLFLAFLYLFSSKKNINITKITILSIIGIFIALTIAKIILPDIYNTIINLRFSLNHNRLESVDAITLISDVFVNSNAFFYIINYIINFIRMLFPFELFFKGKKYILFIIYQLCFTYYFIKNFKSFKCDSKKKVFLSILISYLMVANLFEPDFGSLIRHQTALYFIYLYLFLFKDKSAN